jgi:hypothetical protein
MGWADALSGIDWKGAAKAVLPAAIGTYMAGQANQRAAQTIADANAAASGQMLAGSQAANKRYADIAERTAPAVSYLQSVMADRALTPEQQQRVMDTRRQTGQLLSNRVGGRSATAIATRAAQDLENNIYDRNRARSDQAAGTLAGQNLAAINASAGNDVNLGSNLAGMTERAGENVANAGMATGQLQAQMVGDVMNPRFDAMKLLRSISAEERKGTYPNTKTTKKV